ncbi:hypothetical protein C8R48DRAFT_773916 [Suillus tomentosus]|nr:hypothetical protein C8R48DRAFT_773916 [Suillus tomentosus]
MGGSAKGLYPRGSVTGPPLALLDPIQPDQFLVIPKDIKTATTTYFIDLFTCQEHPSVPKPWLSTSSVLSIHHDVEADPFLWPHPMTLQEFCALLHKGNVRPAPGPDGWEKWQIKCLSDRALQLILDFINYEILESHFPAYVKPSTLSTIHKKDSKFRLTNYYGICCSSFLLNTPFAWLNSLLIPYLAHLHVIPERQVVTQLGVQAHDLLSFLGQIECWSKHTNTPLYALRYNQAKGFDHLKPKGFYDALHAYGLPHSIIAFDRSAQSDVPYSVKTASGLTGSFLISDGKVYVPADSLSLPVSMVEAMDDSIIFGCSLTYICKVCLLLEHFQAVYGWSTCWEKSELLALNVFDPPYFLDMPSLDPGNLISTVPVEHRVQVVTTHAEFL